MKYFEVFRVAKRKLSLKRPKLVNYIMLFIQTNCAVFVSLTRPRFNQLDIQNTIFTHTKKKLNITPRKAGM